MTKNHGRRPSMHWSEFARWVLTSHGRTRRLLKVLRTILAALLLIGVLVFPGSLPVVEGVARLDRGAFCQDAIGSGDANAVAAANVHPAVLVVGRGRCGVDLRRVLL